MPEPLDDYLVHIARNHDAIAQDIQDDASYHRGIAEGIRRAMSIMREDENTDIRFAACPDCGAGHDGSGCDFSCPSRYENDREIEAVFGGPDLVMPAEDDSQEFHSPYPETGGEA
jgi:hypothetical protein